MTIDLLPQLAFTFMAVFARVAAIVMLMPGFSAATVPVRIRLTIGILVTLIMVPLVGDLIPDVPGGPLELFAFLMREIIVGLFIGLLGSMLVSALSTAGTTIAFQMSLSAAQNTDVSTSVQGTLVANFFTVLSMTLIFAMDIDHLVIAAMHDSYELFPPGAPLPVADFAAMAADVFAQSFLIGVQMAAPFIVVGIIFNVGSGILSRLMPQFQVLLVLLPANLMIGFFFLFALLGTMMMWYMEHLQAGISTFIVQ